ncbi:MAG: hypothetical protein JRI25_11590 [Deltaproteobacteria bacterium]|nr:hypothetical protein [Deltaproteobacteria bacterium]
MAFGIPILLMVAPLLALALTAVGLYLGSPKTIWALAVPAVPASILAPLVFGRLEKTREGELLVALVLAGFTFPVGMAGGMPLGRAGVVAGVYGAVLTVATLAVRRVTARALDAETFAKFVAPIVLAVLSVALLVLLVRAGVTTWGAPLATVPMYGFSLYLVLSPPHLRHIRKVGWTLAVCLMLTSIILIGWV